MDLFAGIPVTDYAGALDWYERLFGSPPPSFPTTTRPFGSSGSTGMSSSSTGRSMPVTPGTLYSSTIWTGASRRSPSGESPPWSGKPYRTGCARPRIETRTATNSSSAARRWPRKIEGQWSYKKPFQPRQVDFLGSAAKQRLLAIASVFDLSRAPIEKWSSSTSLVRKWSPFPRCGNGFGNR